MIEEPPLLTIRTPRRRPTEAQIAAFANAPASFVADAMHGRGALDARIRPLGEGRDLTPRAFGPALTAENQPGDIMGTMAALGQIQPGDLVIAAVGGHQGCASAGDLVCGMAKNAGAAGFVTDGPMRDYPGIVKVGLPCWCTGLTPASPFTTGPGRVGLPVQIGGQRVETGDMIVADIDGVVVVPFDEIDDVIAALEQVRKAEEGLETEVANGLRLPAAIEELLASDRTSWQD